MAVTGGTRSANPRRAGVTELPLFGGRGYAARMAKSRITSDWSGADLAAWQEACGFGRGTDAAEALGVSQANYYKYLAGVKTSGGEALAIPLTVELAARWVAHTLKVKLPKLM